MDGSERDDASYVRAGSVGWPAQLAAALTLAWIVGLWLVMIPVAALAFCLLNIGYRLRCVLRPAKIAQANEQLPWVGGRG